MDKKFFSNQIKKDMKIKYLLVAVICFFAINASAQFKKSTFEVYGFAMSDAGYDFKQINPDWYDALRITKLPVTKNEYAPDGSVFMGVRQSRFGVKSNTPTKGGNFKTQFEFDLFGVGADAGQTTFHLRHAYGEIGKFLAGQTWSNFMDADAFPNTLEYWGPTGMVFFRNIQVRYTPLMDSKNTLAIALERPGGSGDGGVYTSVDLSYVKPQFNAPDFTASYKYNDKWGYLKLAGIVRSMKWKNVSGTDQILNDGSAVGWGGNLTTGINLGKQAVLRLQGVYGEGMENYMNDSPADVGLEYSGQFKTDGKGDTIKYVKGIALPIWGATAYIDLTLSKLFKTSFGYSVQTIDNSELQSAEAFKQGQYGTVNILYYPVNNVMAGLEYQFGRRDNKSDGFHSTDSKIQFSFKYNFSNILSFDK